MSDYFFYDLNKKMADLANKQQLTEDAKADPAKPVRSQLNERDLGKHNNATTGFAALAKKTGGGEKGARIAGAQLAKMRAKGQVEEEVDESALSTPISKAMKSGGTRSLPGLPMQPKSTDESAFQAAIGKKKYGDQGMKALQKAGRNHAGAATMNKIRNQYDKYDESMTDEGNAFSGAVARAKADGIQPGEKIRVGGKQYPVREEGGGIPQTPKQKSFAKLAPPVDKITFADKIVGAKKEVDEVLGDVAANAMKKAVGQIDWTNLDRGSNKSSTGGRIDTSKPGVTRHHAGKSYSGAGHDAGADDEPTGALGRRKVGAGMGKKIGAKINRGTSKLMTKENDMDPADQGEYDREGEMAKDDIKTVVRHAQALEKILGDNDNLPEWVQAKLAKIEGMMTAVDDYMQNQKNGEVETEGKKQHFDKGYYDSMDAAKKDNLKSIVKARKQPFEEESDDTRDSRAEKAGKKVAKDIEYDEKEKDGIHGKKRGSEDDKAEKAGKKVTKDIEYDEKEDKKKDDKKEVDETTTSGSVSTGSTGGGHSYGKGIYDSINRDVEKMISESMSINMSMNNDSHGGPSNTLTVTATDEDAKMLAGLLKMAGLGHGDDHIHAMTGDDSDMHAIHDMDQEEPCPSCGSTSCGCDSMDEAYGDTDATQNEPDWPTDQEGTDDAMMYSGGLDGPKSTGQTTIPVINGQHDRMGHAGDHELRRMMEIAGLREAVATPQAVDEPTNTKAKPEAPGSRIKVDPNYKPNAKPTAPASKAPPKIATPQAVDDPSTKIKEGLLMQLRNFKY